MLALHLKLLVCMHDPGTRHLTQERLLQRLHLHTAALLCWFRALQILHFVLAWCSTSCAALREAWWPACAAPVISSALPQWELSTSCDAGAKLQRVLPAASGKHTSLQLMLYMSRWGPVWTCARQQPAQPICSALRLLKRVVNVLHIAVLRASSWNCLF